MILNFYHSYFFFCIISAVLSSLSITGAGEVSITNNTVLYYYEAVPYFNRTSSGLFPNNRISIEKQATSNRLADNQGDGWYTVSYRSYCDSSNSDAGITVVDGTAINQCLPTYMRDRSYLLVTCDLKQSKTITFIYFVLHLNTTSLTYRSSFFHSFFRLKMQ
jgi:hypothetical protein